MRNRNRPWPWVAPSVILLLLLTALPVVLLGYISLTSFEIGYAWADREFVGLAKPFTFDRRPLSPIEPIVIPPGHFFAQGISPDSFDSRYASSGLVRFDQIIGKVKPLF